MNNPFEAILSRLEAIERKITSLNADTDTEAENLIMTRKETMKFLRVNETTLWRLTKDGVLPSYKVGSKVLYKRPEVLAALTKMAA